MCLYLPVEAVAVGFLLSFASNYETHPSAKRKTSAPGLVKLASSECLLVSKNMRGKPFISTCGRGQKQLPHDFSITYNDSKSLGAGISEFEPFPTSRLGINLVPHSTWEFNELVGIPIHLEEASAKVIALLAGIIDVVNQGLVVLSSSSLLRTSVKIYF